jgi:hypothetical protein
MNINKHPNLEDLLKVKKAEQPDDVFWEKFDRDLQEKTLQTFIGQEPWYRNLANKFSQFALSTSMACALIKLVAHKRQLKKKKTRNQYTNRKRKFYEEFKKGKGDRITVVENL